MNNFNFFDDSGNPIEDIKYLRILSCPTERLHFLYDYPNPGQYEPNFGDERFISLSYCSDDESYFDIICLMGILMGRSVKKNDNEIAHHYHHKLYESTDITLRDENEKIYLPQDCKMVFVPSTGFVYFFVNNSGLQLKIHTRGGSTDDLYYLSSIMTAADKLNAMKEVVMILYQMFKGVFDIEQTHGVIKLSPK